MNVFITQCVMSKDFASYVVHSGCVDEVKAMLYNAMHHQQSCVRDMGGMCTWHSAPGSGT